jgi:putative ABC transport system permease protein
MLAKELYFSLRRLKKGAGYTILAAVTLAFGIGVNAAMFTVIEAVLIRSLPYRDAERLVFVGPRGTATFGSLSYLTYRDIARSTRALQQVAAYSPDTGILGGLSDSQRIATPHVTPSLFALLGQEPLYGRVFFPEEGEAGGPPVAILSEQLWRRVFNADGGILGRTIRVNGIDSTVVGVMPSRFRFPEEFGPEIEQAVWLPLQPNQHMLEDRGYNCLTVVGRISGSVSLGTAQSELAVIGKRVRDIDPHAGELVLQVTPYSHVLTGQVRPLLLTLLVAVALVLLVACANVANLLLARGLSRRDELAVRAALGASRWQLVQQFAAEGMVISGLGLSMGLALCVIAVLLLHRLPPDMMPRASEIHFHWSIVPVLGAIALFTTVLSSSLPAILAARMQMCPAFMSGRGASSRVVAGSANRWVVVSEIAGSAVLLVATGLLFRTLWNLEHVQLGFNVAHVVSFEATLPSLEPARVTNSADKDESLSIRVYAPVLERIQQIPGVEAAALTTALPLSGMDLRTSFDIIDKPSTLGHQPHARLAAVSPQYAEVMGTAMLKGRMIRSGDVEGTQSVAVVNETLARNFFPDEDPLQKQLDISSHETGLLHAFSIVGVISDQVDTAIGSPVQPLILISYRQIPTTSLLYEPMLGSMVDFVVRTRMSGFVSQEVRSAFSETAPDVVVDHFRSLRDVVDQNTFNQRLGLWLIASFAGLAILMVIAGVYGILSQIVNLRRREFAVRMALGATRERVGLLILQQASTLIATGCVLGLIGALLVSRLFVSFLYGIESTDWMTYAVVIFVLFSVGCGAAMIPTLRAARIEPMTTLRDS